MIGIETAPEEMELHEKLSRVEATFYRGKESYKLDEFLYDFHNIWIQSWAEGGLVALALLLGIFICALQSKGALRYKAWPWCATQRYHGKFTRQAGGCPFAYIFSWTNSPAIPKEKRESIS